MTNVGISETASGRDGIGKDQLLPANSESMVGRLIADRYVILGLLGWGAMGTVYKARHKSLNREMALKILRREAAEDEMSRKRFEYEARAASCLTHSNLISVTDYGFTEDQTPFLVMDYVEGQSLAAFLKQGTQLPDERIVNIMMQICSGLAHAHDKGLVHRDLKPSNILLGQGEDGATDFVKIVDFGLVKPIAGDSNLTHTGQIFGTPLYMSPEQCEGKKLDGRSDIYAIGCLLYRIVTGKLPFAGDNPIITIVMHVKDTPQAIPEEKLTTPFLKALVPIIFKAMEKNPDARFQSMTELKCAISKAASSDPIIESTASPPASAEPSDAGQTNPSAASARKLIFAGVGCLVATIAATSVITTYMLNHDNSTSKGLHEGPHMAATVTVSPVKRGSRGTVCPKTNQGKAHRGPRENARKGKTYSRNLAESNVHNQGNWKRSGIREL